MSLVHLLTEWLPQQRWFATKSAAVDSLQPKRVAVLVDDLDLRCEIWVVEVEAAGETIRYQVPLAIRSEAAPPQSGAHRRARRPARL